MSSEAMCIEGQATGILAKVCYTVNEAVEATGLSRATLYRAMAEGDLSYSQVGTRRRFLPEHLLEFLKRFEKNTRKN